MAITPGRSVGHWSGQRCPKCQAETLIDGDGNEWCSLIGCTWIPDEPVK